MNAVQRIVASAFERALELLGRPRDVLGSGAAQLLAKESLDEQELDTQSHCHEGRRW